jgi:phosphatidate cytidylyltransferase
MLKTRVIVGSILIALVAGVFYLDYATKSNWGVFSLILVAGVMALYEFYKMHENVYGHINKIIPIVLFVVFLTTRRFDNVNCYIASQVCMFLLFAHPFILTILKGDYEKIANNYVVIVSIIYIIYPLFFIGGSSRLWIIYLIVVNKVADSTAYFGGKFFGKRKLAPNISPNKTWEGFIAAMIIGIIVSVILTQSDYGFCFYQSFMKNLIIGITVILFGQMGDLIESAIKRHCNVKDSGVIPGLGGVLDLIDSIIVSGIAFVFVHTMMLAI